METLKSYHKGLLPYMQAKKLLKQVKKPFLLEFHKKIQDLPT